VVAALSYVPFLVLVPLLARPNSPFSRAHAGQGLLLFIVNAFFALLFFLLIYALGIRGVGLAIMDVFGIVIEFGLLFFTFKHLLLCLDGQFQEFPYVGKYAFIR
jgi:hypothetical protein